MLSIIQKIAYINVSKMPGPKRTNMKKLKDNYEKYWKEIVDDQIKIYDPDVIIFGGTLGFFWNSEGPDFIHTEENVKHYAKQITDMYKIKGKIWIDAYHPSYPMINYPMKKRETYVNSIIKAVIENL